MNDYTKLPEDEWNFVECPETVLHCCWAYELARHLPGTVEMARQLDWKKLKRGSNYGELDENGNLRWRMCGGITDEEEEPEKQFDLRLCSDFPKQPYLRICLDSLGKPSHRVYEKTNLVWDRVPRSTEHPELDPLIFEDPEELRAPKLSVFSMEDASELYGESRFFPGEKFFGGMGLSGNRQTLQAFLINWNHPKRALVEAFAAWIDELENTEQRPYPPLELRGREIIKRYQKRLRQLGAYRLLKFMTGEEAAERFSYRSMYASANDWNRARKAVERRLRWLGLKEGTPDPWEPCQTGR